jgi:hypothetical protein
VGQRDRPPGEHSPWAVPTEDDEPEPDWAEEIRAARRDRGERLRHVYSRFADEPTPLDDEPAPADGEATSRDGEPATPRKGDDRR